MIVRLRRVIWGWIVIGVIVVVASEAQAGPRDTCDPADSIPWGRLTSTRSYWPPRWQVDEHALDRPTWFFVPPTADVLAGQSGPFLSTLSWSDVHGATGLCVYRGTGDRLRTENCTDNGSEYDLTFCALVTPSGISFFGADGLIEAATSVRFAVVNGDLCAPTTVAVELISPPDRDGDGVPDCLESSRDTEPPSWPQGSTLTATASGTNETLAWTAAVDNVGVAGYRIYEDGQIIATVGADVFSADVSDVGSDAVHFFQVQAFDAAGNVSSNGPTVEIIIDDRRPTWPSGATLSIMPEGLSSATLAWPAAMDEVGVVAYRVYRDGALDSTVTGLSTTLGGLDPSHVYVVTVQAVDAAGNESTDGPSTNLRLDSHAPTWPSGSILSATLSGTSATLVWTAALDDVGVAGYRVSENALPVAEVGSGTLSVSIPGLPSDGQVTFRVQAFDIAGNVSTDGPQVLVRVDGTPPTWPASSAILVVRTGARTATLTWNAATDEVGVTGYRVFRDGALFAALSPVTLKLDVIDLDAEATVAFQVQAVDAAGNVSIDGPQILVHLGTPDPALVAPPLDPKVSQTLLDSTAFLFTGTDPIQRDVAAGIIRRERAALIRGRVGERDGTPIADVTIGILGHSELGWTRTRADGAFDLVVNGGGSLVVTYTKNGYLPIQRQVDVPWDDAIRAPDVVLIKLDPAVTEIEVDSPSGQVARGSQVTDADGSRRMTLFIPANTTASMRMVDGTTVPLETMHVRATEYTVGASGPAAMPGDLPASSSYTYAAELSVDEALAAGAKGVEFSQPVPVYVENFLDFPVGETVPVGFYDRDRGVWVPGMNGRVIRVLALVGGLAGIDADGDGQADGEAELAALEISDAERAELGSLYAGGQSLWRVRTTHFSTVDCNWARNLPPDAINPDQDPTNEPDDPRPCTTSGSIIECENQILGEDIGITGTSLSLHYQSERTAGRIVARTAHIPLMGPSVPASLQAIILDIDVAGQHHEQEFAPTPNLSTAFTWDGNDGFGRPVTGARLATISVTYRYPAVYQRTPTFAATGEVAITGTRDRGGVSLARKIPLRLGTARNTPSNSLGGWRLSAHHVYDLEGGTVYRGDGVRQIATRRAQITASINRTWDLASGPDGSIYYIDQNSVWRIGPDNTSRRVAGTAVAGFSGDGGPALLATLNRPAGLAVGPDSSLFILDGANFRVRRVDPFGFISTAAGNGISGQDGDAGPATAASLSPLDRGLAVGRDGSIYVADKFHVRRIGLDGIINRFAGSGNDCGVFTTGCEGDNGPALAATFGGISAIAAAPDGSVLVGDTGKGAVRRIDPNGTISRLAGIYNNPGGLIDGEGVPGVSVSVTPVAIKAGPDNSAYIVDHGFGTRGTRVRRVGPDGIIETVAGGNLCVGPRDTHPVAPLALTLCADPLAVTIDQGGGLSVSDGSKLYVAATGQPNLAHDGYAVPSRDGTQLYAFDTGGRHLRTQDTTTGAVLARFEDGPDGQLAAVIDGDGNTLRIERSNAGQTVLTAPFGQQTVLGMNADGYLERVTDPLGQSVTLTYRGKDLLASLSDPLKGTSTFEYDADGRLTKDTNAGGGFKALARSVDGKKVTVTRTTALGRTTINQTDTTNPTIETKIVSFAGQQATSARSLNGAHAATFSDGTRISGTMTADPRFATDAPVATKIVVQTPSGRSTTATIAKSVILSDPNDPLSVAHLQVAKTMNGSRTWTTTYDAAGRTVTQSTPSGRQTSAVLDAQGRVLQSNEPGRLPRTFKYDGHGRLIQLQQGTRVMSVEYDDDGNVAHTTLPDGRDQRATYDVLGRPLSVTRPDGQQLQYTYELSGRRLLTVPPGRAAHAEEVNPEARSSTYRPPAVVPPTMDRLEQLDLDEQLQSRTNGNGELVTVDRDSAGRPIHVNTPLGTFSYDFDAVTGQLLGRATPEGQSETYGYDGSHLMSINIDGQVAGSVDLSYDTEDRLATDTVDGRSVAYSYDLDDLVIQVGSMVVSRDSANGDVTGSSIENVSLAFVRNGYGEIDDRDAKFAGVELYSAEVFSRDGAGRILRRQETVEGEAHSYAYSYDAAGRLSDMTVDGVPNSHYEYDENGNRLQHDRFAAEESYTYDAQDRLMSAGTMLFTYMADGALETKLDTTTGATTSYTYDVRGSLTKVDLPTGEHVGYITDALGRRVGRSVNGAIKSRWIYAKTTGPAAEVDSAGRTVSRFVYAHRSWVPSYVTKDAGTYAIVTDAIGSVRLVVDVKTGTVAQRLDYDEFGQVIADSNPGFQPFGFGGGLYDASTSLVRFGARDYDATSGRWTQKDPLLFGGGDPNLWTYAGNDPINRIDPSGLAPGDPDPEMQCVAFEFGYSCYGGTGHATTRDVVVAAAIVAGACVAVVGAAIAAGVVSLGATIFGTAETGTAAVVATALPTLTMGNGGKMLSEALGYLRAMAGSLRVEAFENFAVQITNATNGQWSAETFDALNGRVFAGEGGEALVFDALGNMFRGHLSDTSAFVWTRDGLTIVYEALKRL